MVSPRRRKLSPAPDLKAARFRSHREVYGSGQINEWLTIADWTVVETARYFIAYKELMPRAQVAVDKVGDPGEDRRQLVAMLQHFEDHVLRTWVEVGGENCDD